MKCPKCKGTNLRVPNTIKLRGYILRYRECLDCGHRFKTWEIPVASDLPIQDKQEADA